MILNYKKSESTIKPNKVDTTSSKTTVYLRKNITEKTRNNKINGDKQIYYEYEEAKLTKKEYERYVNELTSEDTQKVIEELKNKIKNMSGLSDQIELLTECILEISKLIYE